MKINSLVMLGSLLDFGFLGVFMVGLFISDCVFIFVYMDLWYLDYLMVILVFIVLILVGV